MKKFLSFLISVCLVLTSVTSVPFVSAEKQQVEEYEKEYDYKSYDFEDGFFGDSFPYTGISTGTSVVSEETTAPISGASSYKYQFGGTGTKWALLTPKTAENKLTLGASYRVSGHYKAMQTTSGVISMSIGAAASNSKLHGKDYATAKLTIVNGIAATKDFIGTITTVDAGYPAIYGYSNAADAANDYILLDDIVYAQIIDTVAAVNSDEAKGTVSVANKNESYTDYAMNEIAVFTATPAEGYSFKGWYNGDVLVSDKSTYEHTLIGDVTLTAKWKLYEKEYDYKAYDYEDGFFGDSFPYTGISTSTSVVSEETTAPISGASSYKYLFGGTGTKWALLTPKTAENKLTLGASYRVSGHYKAMQTTSGVISMNIGAVDGNSKLHKTEYANARIRIVNGIASTKKFIGTITTIDAGYPAIYGYTQATDAANDYILLDDIVYAEIIDSVSAISNDASMGSATVTNKAGYTDFAVNETATFNAIPANGHYFVGWYDREDNLVSTDDTFETVVTTDTLLTAKFDSVENLIQVSFNSNGGTNVETISGAADAKLYIPANPTKEGFTFAGWYLDKDCTVKYPCKVFPKEDTTLYAKWINGVYQDFESFKAATNNPLRSEVAEDFTNSYSGTYAYKATGNTNNTSLVVIPQSASGKLSSFANPGDKITISFKYKLVSGSVNFYPHTSTVTYNASAFAKYTNASNKTAYANGFVSSPANFTEASDEWQTFTRTYTLNSQSYFDDLGVVAEDALGYTVLYLTAQSAGTEFYVDDVLVYKTIDIPINYANEAVRLEPVNADKPLTAAIQSDTVEFKAVCDASVTPTIKYGENVLNSVDGVYSITVTADDELTVTTEGVTAAQNHAPGVGLENEDLTKYDPDIFMNKIWEGDTVYHEAVMFVNSVDGTVQTTKKLLYPIDDIISLRNNDLDKWFVKGVDFKVENGKLVWLEGGKCPIYTLPLAVPTDAEDPFYDPALNYGGFNSASAHYTLEKDGPLGLKLMGDAHHEDYTVYVTYKHSKTWDDLGEEGYTPKTPDNQSYDMQKFYNKLATNEDVNVLVYGASTATGCGATGRNLNYELFVGKEPDENGDYEVTLRSEKGSSISAPTFFEQATAELVKKYGNSNKINYYNIAHGGTGAKWGAENLQSRVAFMNKYYGETIVPDIIYIKFAGNNVSTTPEEMVTHYSSMINQFKALYPDVTIVIVAGKINNEKCYIFREAHQNVLEQEKALTELADATPNCIIAKTTSVWAEIVESKNYEDYLSNNINHANDFWSKTTASIIVAAAEKNENVSAVKTAYNSAAALRSGEASSTGKNGLRIYNEIKNEWITAANIVEYGSVAAFALDINGEITIENGRKGIAFSNGTFSAEKQVAWEVKDGSVVFTSYLTNISADRYDDNILIRSYAIAADGTVYYGEEVSVSLFDVANSVDNGNTADGSESSESDKSAFYTFVNDANYNDYKNWCVSQNKNTGSLYNTKFS